MTVSSNSPSFKGVYSWAAPYVVPPLAASVAIIPAFYDLIAKTALQKGMPAPSLNFVSVLQGIKGGFGVAPVVGVLVGAQMALQGRVEKMLQNSTSGLCLDDSNQPKAILTLASSAVVGGVSSPFLAIYNGKTMMPPWSMRESLSRFSIKQAGAITFQETGFVAGLAAADLVARRMKHILGDHQAVDYSAAGIAGALGSLVGHPCNTALTRWQNGMAITNVRQLGWGSIRKARGAAVFAVVYKLVTELLNATAALEK